MRLIVLDLSRLLPGGYATHLLGEMGARVIKIEDPVRGDYLREFPFPLEDGMSAYFHAINRGKQSVALDLKINFCNAVGCESWVPRQFERTKEFHAEVAALFRGRSQADWVTAFANVDTCIEPIVTLNEAAAKGMFRYQDTPAPRLGEHTRAVLEEFGLSDGAAA